MNAELLQTADRALAALLNGVYQGLVLTAAVWLCLRCLRSINAATRHAVWLTTLTAVVALPVLHVAVAERDRLRALSGTRGKVIQEPAESTLLAKENEEAENRETVNQGTTDDALADPADAPAVTEIDD
jgi:hypothetical protein